MNNTFFKHDVQSSFVVFLVALPLCLGIALASGAPLIAGIISGVVGGIVAGSLSGSSLSVSGPAAGLTTIVVAGISSVGSYPAFLFAVVLAGIFQIVLGFLRAGTIGHFFPAAVIRGMLAAIGLILILKQIPHAVGYDADFEGDESFLQGDGLNTFSEIMEATNQITPGAIVISLVSVAILIFWDLTPIRKIRLFQVIPSPLIVVLTGIALAFLFSGTFEFLAINPKHMVSVPVLTGPMASSLFQFPDFSRWNDPRIYMTAASVAAVASIETLLNIEASDKFDPFRRITPLNRELKSQGTANIVAGFLGGLPITSVIVRSSTNITAGAKTKASTIMHGVILLIAVLAIPRFLGNIPLACLAGLLIVVGYNLTKIDLYKEMWKKGISQFLPFIVTIAAILLTDLLLGVFCGVLVSVFFILKTNFQKTVILVADENRYQITFTKDISFLSKATLRDTFYKIPSHAELRIDGTHARFMDNDIKETISDFIETSKAKDIKVELKNIDMVNPA